MRKTRTIYRSSHLSPRGGGAGGGVLREPSLTHAWTNSPVVSRRGWAATETLIASASGSRCDSKIIRRRHIAPASPGDPDGAAVLGADEPLAAAGTEDGDLQVPQA